MDSLKNSQWLKVKSCIWNFLKRRNISQEFSTGSSKRVSSNSSSCPLGKKPHKLAGRLPARLPYFPLMWWMALHLLIRNCWHVSFLSCTTQLNEPWWISNSPLLLGKCTYSEMRCFIIHTRMKWQLHTFENHCVLYQLVQRDQIHFGNAKLWSRIMTEPSSISILLSKGKMNQCNINWHFWVHWTVWFVRLLFSSGFLKTSSFVSWPNKNLLMQCWNHKQWKTIFVLGSENICLEKEKSESFWKLKDKVCCLETANSRPRWFK